MVSRDSCSTERSADQDAVLHRALTPLHRLEDGGLLLDHAARVPHAEHHQCVGHPPQERAQRLQIGPLPRFGTDEEVQLILGPGELILECADRHPEHAPVGGGKPLAAPGHVILGGQHRIEAECRLELADTGVDRFGLGIVVEQVLDQLGRRRLFQRGLPLFGHPADMAIEAGQEMLDRKARLEPFAGDGGHHARGDPPQLSHGPAAGDLLQLGQGKAQAAESLAQLLVAQQAEQAQLVEMPGAASRLAQVPLQQGQGIGVESRGRHDRQVGLEQEGVGEQLRAPATAQIIEQRQQDQWIVAFAGLNPFQVVGELHDGLHQHAAGIVAIRHPVLEQIPGNALHLLGHQRGAVELHHPQAAQDPVQLVGRLLQDRGLLRVLYVPLQESADLLQRLVDFRPNQAQGCRVVHT
jgi:hypothetical protein